jgi:geranylgeranyl diphosphate synthase, type II
MSSRTGAPARQAAEVVPITRGASDPIPPGAVPRTRAEREGLRRLAEDFAAAHAGELVPPLVLDQLRNAAQTLIRSAELNPRFADYAAVLLNNEVWKEHVAGVPYDKRLLLLPRCLRAADECQAAIDEFGLVCARCGLCSIRDLQEEAEGLGYAVLVAEGSDLVTSIIQTGKIRAIVGVSCLSVLEQAFPYMEAASIPGLAIPLLYDGCRNTSIDLDWVLDAIHLTGADRTTRLDLDELRGEVQTWFTPDVLTALCGPPEGETERIARAWLARGGKRWRPFLTVCAWKALQENPDAEIPDSLKRLAIAVECFHKASLVHDDIEDGDAERSGEPTLHAEFGLPVALNCGDLLVGEGYRLIATSDAPPATVAAMMKIASRGHRTLCLGQGAELCWIREPRPMTPFEVLHVFRQKTVPAFEVALQIGAAHAGADEDLLSVLGAFSDALGVAYQIRDDLEDIAVHDLRPSLPLAIAYERAKGEDRDTLERVWWREQAVPENLVSALAESRCRDLLESYRERALRSLLALTNPSLKGLLRRVAAKIFQVEMRGWCSERETRHAGGRAPLAQPPR